MIYGVNLLSKPYEGGVTNYMQLSSFYRGVLCKLGNYQDSIQKIEWIKTRLPLYASIVGKE